MAVAWDPDVYLRFADERHRAFTDLVAHIPQHAPEHVVDLGCGPGSATLRLLDRWPEAQIVGVDQSTTMLARAASVAVPGRLRFEEGDVRTWVPPGPVDVVVSNATLQWVPEHLGLLPTFLGWLTPGGSLAIQMPANFDQPSHALLATLARSPRWAPAIGQLVRDSPVADPATYLRSLRTAGAHGDVWETTYLHLLSGPDAVLGWMRGTGLRPFLAALEERVSADECRAFLDTYTEALRSAYPPEPDGHTVLPFRRIFAVATMPGAGGSAGPHHHREHKAEEHRREAAGRRLGSHPSVRPEQRDTST